MKSQVQLTFAPTVPGGPVSPTLPYNKIKGGEMLTTFNIDNFIVLFYLSLCTILIVCH